MKKVAIILIVVLIALAIGMALFLNRMDGIISGLIETQGTLALGTPVRVASVKTDLRQGTATITGLTIDNANGFNADHAVKIPFFKTQVAYASQNIESIIIDKAVINAELIAGKNNFQALLENMPSSDNSQSSTAEGGDIVLTIERLAVTNGQVNLSVSQPELGDHTFIMDDLVVTNLKGNAEQLSEQILDRLTRHISKQVTNYAQRELQTKAVDALKDKLQDKLKGKLGDKLKELGF